MDMKYVISATVRQEVWNGKSWVIIDLPRDLDLGTFTDLKDVDMYLHDLRTWNSR